MDYTRYMEIVRQIGLLEQEQKILKAAILKHLQEEKTDRVVVETGVISLKSRTTWQYPPAVKTQIEAIQRESQESGEAKQVQSPYLSTSLK